MLDSIKKLILSNKYSLLVLLILSLWLRLAKDYSIILSYIVLLIMYLAIGMVVSYVLEIFESKKSVSDSADASEAKRASVSAAKKREVIGHKELQRHSEKARVTSSYVKNAEGMSSSMSRRLEKTAATFNSIKGDSDKFAEEEKKQSSLYGNTRKILFENPEELYKNKKNNKTTPIEETPVKAIVEKECTSEKDANDLFKSDIFSDNDDYNAVSSDEVDDIVKDIDSRINEPRKAKRPLLSEIKEISFEPSVTARPVVKGSPLQVASEAKSKEVSTSKPAESVKPTAPISPRETIKYNEPVTPAKPQRNTHVVKDDNQDSVNADMDKLDKLFNRSRNKDDGKDDKPKSGFFSGLKKKRK